MCNILIIEIIERDEKIEINEDLANDILFGFEALATTIAGTTIIGSTAFADEISTLTQQKQDKQNELDQLQQQAAVSLF